MNPHTLPKGLTFIVAGRTYTITDYNVCRKESYYVRCPSGTITVWDMA